jgi:hypothetical protein
MRKATKRAWLAKIGFGGLKFNLFLLLHPSARSWQIKSCGINFKKGSSGMGSSVFTDVP